MKYVYFLHENERKSYLCFTHQNGKKISTLDWDNWLNLTIWKFTHFLQNALQNLRQINQSTVCKDDPATTGPAQLPTKFIDCLSLSKKDAAKSEDEPQKSNVKENSNDVDVPANQLSSEQTSADANVDVVVQQKGKFYHQNKNKIQFRRIKFNDFSLSINISHLYPIFLHNFVHNSDICSSNVEHCDGNDAVTSSCASEKEETLQADRIERESVAVDATLPTVSKPTFGCVEYGGEAKKYASTGTLYSCSAKQSHLKAADTHKKMQNLAASTATMSSDAQSDEKIVEATTPSSEGVTAQDKSGKMIYSNLFYQRFFIQSTSNEF